VQIRQERGAVVERLHAEHAGRVRAGQRRGSPGPSTRSWPAPSLTASAALDDPRINMISF
jgi:hypothetical protein